MIAADELVDSLAVTFAVCVRVRISTSDSRHKRANSIFLFIPSFFQNVFSPLFEGRTGDNNKSRY